MSKQELDLYLTGNMKDVGSSFLKGKLANNHRYKKGENYVHLFRNIKDINFIKHKRKFDYIAVFDIPLITLMISYGRGYYTKLNKGFLQCKYINEFAINSKRMKAEYFLAYKELSKSEYKADEMKNLLDDIVIVK